MKEQKGIREKNLLAFFFLIHKIPPDLFCPFWSVREKGDNSPGVTVREESPAELG